MNEIQQGMIALMKSAMLGQSQQLPEGFELQAALPWIRRHHIAALIYDGAERCGVSRQEPGMEKLFRAYCSSLLVNEGQQREIGRIFAAFEENGIDYMPLKGCNMKALYPRPEMRVMGDADILIRMEQYGRIVPILKTLGFEHQYESDHELVWKTSALNLELHSYLMPTSNRLLYEYFGDGWKMAVPGGGSRWDMCAEDAFVFLFAHFAKHYRRGGIGCRHVLDLWAYLRANPQMDMGRVLETLEGLQLRRFYESITGLLAVWFDGAEPDDRTELITEFIFNSGSWGSAQSRAASAGVANSRQTNRVAEGRMRYLLSVAFPNVEALRGKYPVLKKAPWLLPGVWLVRPVNKLLHDRKVFRWHRWAAEAMDQEKLDSFRQMLEYVGLEHRQEQ